MWLDERWNDAPNHMISVVTLLLVEIMEQCKHESFSFNVVPSNLYEFEVHGGDRIRIMNMKTKEC